MKIWSQIIIFYRHWLSGVAHQIIYEILHNRWQHISWKLSIYISRWIKLASIKHTLRTFSLRASNIFRINPYNLRKMPSIHTESRVEVIVVNRLWIPRIDHIIHTGISHSKIFTILIITMCKHASVCVSLFKLGESCAPLNGRSTMN